MANHLLSKMQTERRKKMTQDPVNMIASGKKEFPPALAFSSGQITLRSRNPSLHNSKTRKKQTEERRDTDEDL
jgi:hypothetical protein